MSKDNARSPYIAADILNCKCNPKSVVYRYIHDSGMYHSASVHL